MTVSIIQAGESDAERVRAYYANLLSEKMPYILANPVPSLEEEQEFVRKHDGKQSVLLLAITDDQLVGMAGFNRATHPQHAHCCSFAISVARAHRGQGIGARLIEAGVEWCRSKGVVRLECEVVEGNPAVRFYQRLGFLQEGCKKQAIKVQDEYRALILMARILA